MGGGKPRDSEWAKLATSGDTDVPSFKLLATTTTIIIEQVFTKCLLHAHFTRFTHLMFTATLEVGTIISILQMRKLRHKAAKSLARGHRLNCSNKRERGPFARYR